MLEELLVGAYLAEVDRAVARAIRLPEAGTPGTNLAYGRLHQPLPFAERLPMLETDTDGNRQAA